MRELSLSTKNSNLKNFSVFYGDYIDLRMLRLKRLKFSIAHPTGERISWRLSKKLIGE
jgi:hypothetical protein